MMAKHKQLEGGDALAGTDASLRPKAALDVAPGAESASATGGGHPMDDAPKTGVPIILVGATGEEVAARWRSTRRMVVDNDRPRWEPTGFWVVLAQSGNQRVPFEPVGWRPYVY